MHRRRRRRGARVGGAGHKKKAAPSSNSPLTLSPPEPQQAGRVPGGARAARCTAARRRAARGAPPARRSRPPPATASVRVCAGAPAAVVERGCAGPSSSSPSPSHPPAGPSLVDERALSPRHPPTPVSRGGFDGGPGPSHPGDGGRAAGGAAAGPSGRGFHEAQGAKPAEAYGFVGWITSAWCARRPFSQLLARLDVSALCC